MQINIRERASLIGGAEVSTNCMPYDAIESDKVPKRHPPTCPNPHIWSNPTHTVVGVIVWTMTLGNPFTLIESPRVSP